MSNGTLRSARLRMFPFCWLRLLNEKFVAHKQGQEILTLFWSKEAPCLTAVEATHVEVRAAHECQRYARSGHAPFSAPIRHALPRPGPIRALPPSPPATPLRCHKVYADGKCVCDIGHAGADCSQGCPGGTALPCAGHGVCDASTSKCSCAVGWATESCDVACPGVREGAAVCYGHGQCRVCAAQPLDAWPYPPEFTGVPAADALSMFNKRSDILWSPKRLLCKRPELGPGHAAFQCPGGC